MIQFSVAGHRKQLSIDADPFHEYRFDDGTVWTEFYRLDRSYLLRFPSLADFEVSSEGQVVVGFPAADTDETTLEHLYINQVMPLALSRQGRPAFHASVVTVPGGSVAFLGETGTGKSTLAASFALGQSAFLTDDALLVEEQGDTVLALPSHASLRLWEDSLEALMDDGRHQAASHISYSTKARILAGDVLIYQDEPLPLLAAYRLTRAEPAGVMIEPLAGAERHMAWVENSFLLDITDQDLLSRHFDWNHRIAEKVPTFGLDYQRDYGKLPDVRKAIVQHISQIGDSL